MTWLLRHLPQVIVAAILTGLLAWGGHGLYRAGYNAANVRAEKVIGQFAKAEADAQARARQSEQTAARANEAAAAQYEKGKQDAQAAADAVIAGLRTGAVQLRNRWQGCLATGRVSGTAASAAESDAAAADRAESAARIVRAAAEADAQIRGLQDIVRADRAGDDAKTR